jgi:hypothetical protein
VEVSHATGNGLFNRAAYSTLTWTARGIGHVPPLRHALMAAVERRLRRSAADMHAEYRFRGRHGNSGYLYMNWNGDVCPCVFVPYSPVNIKDVFARGGTLDDVWSEPLFGAFRNWQHGYGFREDGQPYGGRGNWLMPCPIRDHYSEFLAMLNRHPAKPIDADAKAALEDAGYAAGLEKFGEQLGALTDPIWRERYLTASDRSR